MTMAIIDSLILERTSQPSTVTVYFFYQNAVDGMNSAVGVLRGLIYSLVCKERSLLETVE
jgi:hypothetical protein